MAQGGGNHEPVLVPPGTGALTPRAPKPPAAPASNPFDTLATTPITTPNPASAGAGSSSDLVAPMSGGESQTLDSLIANLNNPSPAMSAGQGQLTDTIGGKYLTPDSNPFLAAAIQAAQRSVQNNFSDVTVPQLLSRFTGSGQQVQGQGSSPFANAAMLASRDLNNSLGDIATNMASQNYATERQNQLGAVQTASTLNNSQITNLIQGLQATALPRLIQDMGIQRGIEAFNQRVQVMLQALQIAAGVSQPTIANSSAGKSTGDTQTGVLPAVGQFVGGFTGGA